MNVHYLETLTLEVPFRHIISFFSRINFQFMSPLMYTVYCRSSYQSRGVLKGKHLCWSLFNNVSGLTPILKNICQQLLLHCTCTLTVTYTFYFIFSTFFSSSLLLLLISPMFVFGSNWKGFKEFKSGISFSLKSHFHCCYFLFPSFPVLFQFLLSLPIKKILLSWELIKIFLPPLTSLKYVRK